MIKVTNVNLLAIGLALGAAVIGYSVPVVGYVVGFVVALVLLVALLGSGSFLDMVPPLVAGWRWLAQKDDYRWLRRAPLLGLFVGTLASAVWGG